MIQAKCIDRYKDANGNIYGYLLEDINGQKQECAPDALKNAIRSNQINIVNLTLTSDNRLIVKEPEKQLQNIQILGNAPEKPGDKLTLDIIAVCRGISKRRAACDVTQIYIYTNDIERAKKNIDIQKFKDDNFKYFYALPNQKSVIHTIKSSVSKLAHKEYGYTDNDMLTGIICSPIAHSKMYASREGAYILNTELFCTTLRQYCREQRIKIRFRDARYGSNGMEFYDIE